MHLPTMSLVYRIVRVGLLLLCAAAAPVSGSTRLVPAAAFQTTANADVVRGPPLGAVYHRALHVPVLGRQSFRLRILDNGRAHLCVDGVLEIDEIMDYQVRPSGAFSLILPDRLQQVLNRFRTKLVDFGYDRVNDLPFVVVSPPIPTKIHIRLLRDHGEQNVESRLLGSPR